MGTRATPRYVAIARILKPFGYKGEVKAEILTDFPDRFAKLKKVFLEAEEGEPRAFEVERARLHQNGVRLKLAGVDTPEAAARLRDQTVLVEIADVVPLKKGQYYQYQLIGLKVITEAGEALGELTEILETGANDVYVVTGAEGREILLPATDEVIRAIEVERGEMVVRRLEGL